MATIKKINPFIQFGVFNVDALIYFLSNAPVPPAYEIEDIAKYLGAYYDTIVSNAANFSPITKINTSGIVALAANAFYDNDLDFENFESPIIRELFEYTNTDNTQLYNFLNNKEKSVLSAEGMDSNDRDLILSAIATCRLSLDYWISNVGAWAAFSVTATPGRLALSSMRAVILFEEQGLLAQLIAASSFGVFDAIENN